MFIKKIKNKFESEDNKRLLSNFISLLTLQGINYIMPLITLPYLVRVIGVEYFGLLAFATSFIAYFLIITDYGFNLTATREISLNRDNTEKIIEIFSVVMTIKLLLMLFSFFTMSLIVFSFEKFSKDWEVYYLTFGIVIGQGLFPIWFFQGMEKMKYITYLNILAKVIFTIAIFIFVNEKNDYWIVPMLTSIGFIIAGICSISLIKKEFLITFKMQNKSTIICYFKDGWHIFLSNMAINIYTVSTTFILGIFTNNIVVGYYAAADKIIQAFSGLISPISQTLYPYVAQKVHKSKEEGLNFIKYMFKYIFFIMGFISIGIYFTSDIIINILLGPEYHNSIIILTILSLLPFLIGLSNIFGIQTMLNFDRKEAFSKILLIGSILSITISFILVPKFEHIGSAITVLIVETFITITMFIYLQKNQLKLIGENK